MSEHYKPIPLNAPPMNAARAPQRGASYPDEMTKPMREELVRAGVVELTSREDVDRELSADSGPVAVIINSVCGCAAGGARPGLLMALRTAPHKPAKVLTAFAGVHPDAVAAVRERIPAPPSSPNIIMFNGGKPVMMMHRSDIEVRDAGSIAAIVTKMFAEVTAAAGAPASA
jgi:putative YphP/YqiW family bacilliredoxin